MDTIKVKDHGNTKMIAHRGLSGLERENTMAAFVAAGNRNYFGIETDVRKAADGEFVIFHDDITSRVAADNYEIGKTSLDILQQVVLNDIDGEKGRVDLRIPTLRDYIRICKKYDKKCVLELKDHFSVEDIKQIVSLIEREEYIDNVIFISFSFDNLIDLRKIKPNQEIQYLIWEFNDDIYNELKKYNFTLDIHYPHITKEIVEKLHKDNIKVNVWTCDNVDDAEKLIEYGVDFITTNILE